MLDTPSLWANDKLVRCLPLVNSDEKRSYAPTPVRQRYEHRVQRNKPTSISATILLPW